MHEQIENEYIIGLLQQRCCTVHNVHSDNKLSEMLSLFEKGLHSVKVNMHRFFKGFLQKEVDLLTQVKTFAKFDVFTLVIII